MMGKYTQSLALFERASSVIPGGIYGHVSPATVLPKKSPYYAERGEGAYYWDVDGNRYIDFMCGYGPAILGYRNSEVEEAVNQQRKSGGVFNHPTKKMVQLAEKLVENIDFADWAVFAKNGSDLTTWAVQVARESTFKKGIMKVKGAYHGVDAWCSPGKGGMIEEDLQFVYPFIWNDLESFNAVYEENLKDLSCVILTPYHHPVFEDNILPEEGFIQHIQKRCNHDGVLLILDDVRAGFRLHSGGSHRYFNFQPDIAVYCKALGNGYAISAACGKEEFKVPASRVFLTGSYWNDALAMSAAEKCIEIIERDAVPEKLRGMGNLLRIGLIEAAEKHGFQLTVSGPVSMPYVNFTNDKTLKKIQEFCSIAIDEGAFFHPHHNWFLGAAHTEKDIRDAISIADFAFSKMAST